MASEAILKQKEEEVAKLAEKFKNSNLSIIILRFKFKIII